MFSNNHNNIVSAICTTATTAAAKGTSKATEAGRAVAAAFVFLWHDDAEDVQKIMMLMQGLTMFMYLMYFMLRIASLCFFLHLLKQFTKFRVWSVAWVCYAQGAGRARVCEHRFPKGVALHQSTEVCLDLETLIFLGQIFHFHDLWEECLVLIPYQLAVTRDPIRRLPGERFC